MSEIEIKKDSRVFFLDDDIERIWKFKALMSGIVEHENLVIAESVHSAEVVINRLEDYDVVFLDHDLVPDHYDDLEASAISGKNTGQEVIPLFKNHKNKKFILHTMNPYGADVMESILVVNYDVDPRNVFQAPFGTFTLKELN